MPLPKPPTKRSQLELLTGKALQHLSEEERQALHPLLGGALLPSYAQPRFEYYGETDPRPGATEGFYRTTPKGAVQTGTAYIARDLDAPVGLSEFDRAMRMPEGEFHKAFSGDSRTKNIDLLGHEMAHYLQHIGRVPWRFDKEMEKLGIPNLVTTESIKVLEKEADDIGRWLVLVELKKRGMPLTQKEKAELPKLAVKVQRLKNRVIAENPYLSQE